MPVVSIVAEFHGLAELQFLLDVVTRIDVHQMLKRDLPKLFQSGLVYQRESCVAPPWLGGCERFLTARQVLREKAGDCDDLAPYLAAQVIVERERVRAPDIALGVVAPDLWPARAVPVESSVGYHVLTRLRDGSFLDPSKTLGMKGDV